MDLPRWVGLGCAVASTLLGAYGLLHVKPLPLSARLGALAPLDRNEDGRISRAEWQQAGRSPASMAALDADHDGYVEPGEARRSRSARGGH